MQNIKLAAIVGLICSGLTIGCSSAIAEIKNIKDLPRVDIYKTKAYDYPMSHPILVFDEFTTGQELMVADIQDNTNFLGLSRDGIFSLWSANTISFIHCTRTLRGDICSPLNGRAAYVKVEGHVFELKTLQKQTYSMPASLQISLQNTSSKVYIRIELDDEVIDKEIGKGTIQAYQDIKAYLQRTQATKTIDN
jgi:hypothetical protein